MNAIVGIDVGGTFTDFALATVDREALLIHKVATTPDNPADGIVRGLTELCDLAGIEGREIASVYHGTTTATNAMLENKGAVTGMITNDGFRDIVHIGRHQRVQHYSIMQDLPWQSRPLVHRRHRKTVSGRLAPPDGHEIETLDEAAVRQAAEELAAAGVEAICICFLFSFLNPDHEQRAAAIVREACPDLFVTTSSAVAPQFREFERFTTTAMSAFVGPKMRGYIGELQSAFDDLGVAGELHIMASNGGLATPAMVAERPAVTLLSGLVAGVRGGAWLGELAGVDKVITLDIGGTSADIGIVRDGQFAEMDSRSAQIAGFPVLLPMIDIHTIGAGGGSIAYRDRGGAFKVGPESAGAVPGPAAYGQGGDRPTVTDANLVLGRLLPEDFLGGQMALDLAAADRVIGTLAADLGQDKLATAEGILTVLNSNMANAIRSRTVQRGIDPRDFTLAAFGGAGPLHGAEVARLLGVKRVLVPPYPGITSAMGLLTSDLQYEAIRTAFQTDRDLDRTRLERQFAEMAAELAELFDRDGATDIHYRRSGDLRYVGQGYELKVPIPDGDLDQAALAQVWQAFHDQHRSEYGHAFEDSAIEIVTVRISGRGAVDKLERLPVPTGDGDAAVGTGTCMFRVDDHLESFETAYLRRDRLATGQDVPGPAIILQTDSTTVVPPGWHATVDPVGNLILTEQSS